MKELGVGVLKIEGSELGSFKNRGAGVGAFVYGLHSPDQSPVQMHTKATH
jgi:hypothetical protein